MKEINAKRFITIPKGVTVTLKSRKVTVTGPRGTLKRSFQHQKIDLKLLPGGKKIKAEMWFGNRKGLATIRTICSHIENMITGVTKGYEYKMRMVYAHFPINVSIENDGSLVAVRNFLGEKVVRNVPMLEGVSVTKSTNVKDELVFVGNNIDNVSQSAANVQQCVLVRNKDIRKFLDGIYVSEKGLLVKDD
eukprot:TRINITY_DN26828_c0_g1_i1.p1 TRINITY_DN26828_c0_g1~~TRINITY_DN26828_c0_g1_i1.p1  ORF type:complete len:217 (+),score=104.76 TRINITY_DN26828_c0_g1_i1:81-653(+)